MDPRWVKKPIAAGKADEADRARRAVAVVQR
jgi:hypothetical protein